MRTTLATFFAGLLSSAWCLPVEDSQASLFYQRQLAELPKTWIENIAVRRNGNLLLNTFNNGQMYTADPSQSPLQPRIIAKVEGVNALYGITEVGRDIFAVAGANFDPATMAMPDQSSMRLAVVSFQSDRQFTDGNPSVEVILKNTTFGAVNGLTSLSCQRHIVLGAISATGEILRVNTKTRVADIAFKDEEFTIGSSGLFPFGVNGLKIFNSYLYFTNTNRQTFGRVKIDKLGNKVGNVEIITRAPANSTLTPDDFVIDKLGNAYVGFWPSLLVKIAPDGKQTILVNGTLAGPTSEALSRDGKTLYTVTAGLGLATVGGGQILEAKV
ncbi:hypothetical protein CkaCkLH20_09972 [Colletotrichum karsti]|uniref:SMP-30/Gluconolactonase/LRE-like region domain-containing protein n=1 Tax=Colletotrichum karsti TaxID=1095194 RepID=A0A9P6LHC4_9PEZI|nr:uncharacterized protein CkaCkLH20_09972 [Colletotrichum karsti]KAF9872475.1 hypothetical protein CkaCkLH20_09972 [Colletotrichum karsti]